MSSHVYKARSESYELNVTIVGKIPLYQRLQLRVFFAGKQRGTCSQPRQQVLAPRLVV